MGSEDNIFSLIGVKYPSAGMDICKLCSAVLYSTYDYVLSHVCDHTRSFLSNTFGRSSVASNGIAFSFTYVLRIFPVLALVNVHDPEKFVDTATKLGQTQSINFAMFNLACVSQSPYKTSNEYNTNFREYIRKQNYYCGICDLDYDDGLPSIELAVRHMNIHFTFTGRGQSSTTPKSEA